MLVRVHLRGADRGWLTCGVNVGIVCLSRRKESQMGDGKMKTSMVYLLDL